MSFDFVDYKKDFPLLMQQDVAYLDSAATAQRPASVLQAEKEFYEQANAVHKFSVRDGFSQSAFTQSPQFACIPERHQSIKRCIDPLTMLP